jgi:hypothetical protein
MAVIGQESYKPRKIEIAELEAHILDNEYEICCAKDIRKRNQIKIRYRRKSCKVEQVTRWGIEVTNLNFAKSKAYEPRNLTTDINVELKELYESVFKSKIGIEELGAESKRLNSVVVLQREGGGNLGTPSYPWNPEYNSTRFCLLSHPQWTVALQPKPTASALSVILFLTSTASDCKASASGAISSARDS